MRSMRVWHALTVSSHDHIKEMPQPKMGDNEAALSPIFGGNAPAVHAPSRQHQYTHCTIPLAGTDGHAHAHAHVVGRGHMSIGTCTRTGTVLAVRIFSARSGARSGAAAAAAAAAAPLVPLVLLLRLLHLAAPAWRQGPGWQRCRSPSLLRPRLPPPPPLPAHASASRRLPACRHEHGEFVVGLSRARPTSTPCEMPQKTFSQRGQVLEQQP